MKKFNRSKFRGVTPIIATVLILALVIAGVVIAFVQILPYIEQSRVETGSAAVQSSLINFDNTIWDMIGDSSKIPSIYHEIGMRYIHPGVFC